MKTENFSPETIQRCIKQIDSLIDDRKSFVVGDKEYDEIFLEDIFYLETTKKILSEIKSNLPMIQKYFKDV